MKILIVEDDFFKYSKIEEVVYAAISNAVITKADNVHDAISILKDELPQKIILDMALPSHAAKIGEGSPVSMPNGGVEVLLELRAMNQLHIQILVLTQYDAVEIDNEYYSIEESCSIIEDVFGFVNILVVHYENESDFWKEKIKLFLVENESSIN